VPWTLSRIEFHLAAFAHCSGREGAPPEFCGTRAGSSSLHSLLIRKSSDSIPQITPGDSARSSDPPFQLLMKGDPDDTANSAGSLPRTLHAAPRGRQPISEARRLPVL